MAAHDCLQLVPARAPSRADRAVALAVRVLDRERKDRLPSHAAGILTLTRLCRKPQERTKRLNSVRIGNKYFVAKGDFVEILVDAGNGAAREYIIEAKRAGRSVEVRSSRTSVEVRELTRNGGVVRTARFVAPRVLAVVEHPKAA